MCFEGKVGAGGGKMEIENEKKFEMDEHVNFIDNVRILES